MRSINRLSLLAVMALAVAALAAPAFATAANWTEPADLSEAVEAGYTGQVHFESTEWTFGYTCEIEAGATLEPGGSGSIDSFGEPQCWSTGGFEGCTNAEGESLETPTMEVSEQRGAHHEWLAERAVNLDFLLMETTDSCFGENGPVTLYGGAAAGYSSIVMTPDESSSIGEFTLSGQGKMEIRGLGTYEATISGSLKSTEPGAYGIFGAYGSRGGHWFDTENPPVALEEQGAVELTGSVDYWVGAPGSSIECEDAHGVAALEPAGKAHVYLRIDPERCTGSGAFESCAFDKDYVRVEGGQINQSGDLEAESLYLGVFDEREEAGWWCQEGSAIEAEPLTLTPDDHESISAFSADQNVDTTWGPETGHLELELHVDPAGVYGIET